LTFLQCAESSSIVEGSDWTRILCTYFRPERTIVTGWADVFSIAVAAFLTEIPSWAAGAIFSDCTVECTSRTGHRDFRPFCTPLTSGANDLPWIG
jgi:hypothetical protein